MPRPALLTAATNPYVTLEHLKCGFSELSCTVSTTRWLSKIQHTQKKNIKYLNSFSY